MAKFSHWHLTNKEGNYEAPKHEICCWICPDGRDSRTWSKRAKRYNFFYKCCSDFKFKARPAKMVHFPKIDLPAYLPVLYVLCRFGISESNSRLGDITTVSSHYSHMQKSGIFCNVGTSHLSNSLTLRRNKSITEQRSAPNTDFHIFSGRLNPEYTDLHLLCLRGGSSGESQSSMQVESIDEDQVSCLSHC